MAMARSVTFPASSPSSSSSLPRHQHQPQESQPSVNDRTGGDLRETDSNLGSLCDHIQIEGFNNGVFSDVVVQAMGSTYHLHRLILSRSSYFRHMLHGPWKEADAPTVVLHIDDANVNSESIDMALAYLYGHHPKLHDNNAFRVLAAASFLDLQDLCGICTDFIISELWTSNFLAYQVFAESQDYGIHGERVRNACWGYLCQSGTMELREVLPKLSSQTLHVLLTSDELWVPSEEKRFELAVYTLLAKGSASEAYHAEHESSSSEMGMTSSETSEPTGKNLTSNNGKHLMESELPQPTCFHPMLDSSYSSQMGRPTINSNACGASCSFVETHNGIEAMRIGGNEASVEGPSGESTCYQINNNIWLPRDQLSESSSANGVISSDWARCSVPPLWGGRIVGRRQVKSTKGNWGIQADEYEAFMNIFEGGSLLYCNMSFEALLNVRKQLEELGFPCKAVNDGLWLQMLLCQRVQAIAAETCKNCCLTRCACRQSFGCSIQGGGPISTFGGPPQGVPIGYYRQEHDRSNVGGNIGNIYLADPPGEGNASFGPARVHVRGPIDGLAGIGRGDGLTALVNLSQGSNAGYVNTEQTDRVYELPNASGIPVQILDSQEHALGVDWGSSDGSSISLDLKTPLRNFPPFRFGVEFEDVYRLTDGQVKHSPEVFYAGSLWKVSVQAFNDEDPQGRRTLGLFLHRRKAEVADSSRKVHMYVDTREKVTARYQLICPSKREVMVFGSFKQAGTQLPKAPKGWGWRTALLFDELADLLQGGTLRIAAVVQLV